MSRESSGQPCSRPGYPIILIRLSNNPQAPSKGPASDGICMANLDNAGTEHEKKFGQSYHCTDDDGGVYGTEMCEIAIPKRKEWLSRACELSQDNTKGVELQ